MPKDEQEQRFDEQLKTLRAERDAAILRRDKPSEKEFRRQIQATEAAKEQYRKRRKLRPTPAPPQRPPQATEPQRQPQEEITRPEPPQPPLTVPVPAQPIGGDSITISSAVGLRDALTGNSQGRTFLLRPGRYELGNEVVQVKASRCVFKSADEKNMAIIDGPILLKGTGTTLENLRITRGPGASRTYMVIPGEVKRFDPLLKNVEALVGIAATDCALIECHIDSSTGTGVTAHEDTTAGFLMRGCIVRLNGMNQKYGHGGYFNGTGKTIVDNIFCDNAVLGLSFHAEQKNHPTAMRDMIIRGNVMFGSCWMGKQSVQNLEAFSGYSGAQNCIIEENFTGGRLDENDADAELSWNRSVGIVVRNNHFQRVTKQGDAIRELSTFDEINRNDTQVFVRKVSEKRAHIIVYNPTRLPFIDVSLNGVVPVGAAYELRNSQSFGSVMMAGIFGGQILRVPMTGGTVEQPHGAPVTIPSTLPEFGCFAVLVG